MGVNATVSVYSVWSCKTSVRPSQAVMLSELESSEIVTPASLVKPSSFHDDGSVVVASVGRGVFSGATEIAPVALAEPAVTWLASIVAI